MRFNFAKALSSLGRDTQRTYGGFVRRESITVVKALIVTADTESDNQLGSLWGFLQSFHGVLADRTCYEHHDVVNSHYLLQRFMVVKPNGEETNWSNDIDDFDESASASHFSIVSSIR